MAWMGSGRRLEGVRGLLALCRSTCGQTPRNDRVAAVERDNDRRVIYQSELSVDTMGRIGSTGIAIRAHWMGWTGTS